jgi:5-methylcytosine-specific restriction endonuclease McrA
VRALRCCARAASHAPSHRSLQAKTSRSWARKQVFKEERGVCQECGLDCEDLKSRLLLGSKGAQLPLEDRRRILLQVEPRYKEHEALMMKALTTGCVALEHTRCCGVRSVKPDWACRRCSVLWEADHLIPVAEGGGQCGRENLRTLCLMCHVDASGAQAGRGAKKRRAAKASRAVAVDQPLDDATLAALGRCAADDEDEFEEDKPPKSKSTKPKKAKAKAGK